MRAIPEDPVIAETNMKVLIISAFPPDPAPEANHALHLSEHIAASGLGVHVLCKKGGIGGTRANVVVHPVIEDWGWSDLPRVAECMRGCRPDVVLLLYIGWVYNRHPMITFLPTFCRRILPAVPCITQFENVDQILPRRSLLARALREAMALWAGRKDLHPLFGTLLRDSARIITLSSPHKARLVKQDPELAEKIVILPPPPLLRFCSDPPAIARKQARATIGATDNDFILVYWGYIYPGKGVETLLRAFRIVCRRNVNMRLVLVGGSLEFPTGRISSNDYFQMVRQLPEKLGIAERVTWTGHFDWDSDVGSRYLHAGDACVLPFDYGVTLNNSSLAAATTHGLPVVSTELAVGRDEALEHGRNIYLCRPKRPEMLADAIQLISEDAALRERLRRGSLGLARDWYRSDIMTKRLVGIMESAVSRHEASAGEPSYAAAYEAEMHKKRIFPDISPRERDDEFPKVQGGNSHASSGAWPKENPPDPVNVPPVSVVVAVHNVEKYLSQCLDSLVHQTLKGVEIIVVNDASTDHSAEIVNDYKSKYPNLQVVDCKQNKGLASVRNIGMRAAKGQYIAFTDGDDWVDVRMCEVMYRRASENDADVLIANATVFYEDSKTFGKFFDHHIRQTLDPGLRTMPFDLRSNPRVLLLEPVAWTKLYKRSFLREDGIEFEEGMNSYEDICFHFSVLLKARRISLIDETVSFYRQNRPGQISGGRTNRKVFEIFPIFQKIHENLAAWNVSDDIWAMLVQVELRQFDWLLRDRVQARHKREFLASVAKQFGKIPACGLRNFVRQANPHDLARLFCMRKNWLYTYEQVTRRRWPLFPLLYAALHPRRRRILKRGLLHGLGMLRRRMIALYRSFVKKSVNLAPLERKLLALQERLNQLIDIRRSASHGEEPLVETRRIGNEILFLSYPSSRPGVSGVLWPTENDYYLTQTAVFREGDTVVDVGAHVGAVTIYLAKKYPFIKIYALEPDPLNYACLKRNIELNEVTNVVAINKALSGNGQKRTLYVDGRGGSWATIDARLASSREVLRIVPVETVTLERLFQEHGIRHCRLLKITAPGAIQESLRAFMRSGCVDLLCGEVDLRDCSLAKLEVASWRIARQHFWRTIAKETNGTADSWIHQLPTEIERLHCKTASSVTTQAALLTSKHVPPVGIMDPKP